MVMLAILVGAVGCSDDNGESEKIEATDVSSDTLDASLDIEDGNSDGGSVADDASQVAVPDGTGRTFPDVGGASSDGGSSDVQGSVDAGTSMDLNDTLTSIGDSSTLEDAHVKPDSNVADAGADAGSGGAEVAQVCEEGGTSSKSCSTPGDWACPPGKATKQCNGGKWGPYGQCVVPFMYYGSGSKACGDTICIQTGATGSDTKVKVTVSKNGGSSFQNKVQLTIWSPTTGKSVQLGCVSIGVAATYEVSAASLGMDKPGNYLIKAQVFSPCVNGGDHSSGVSGATQCME